MTRRIRYAALAAVLLATPALTTAALADEPGPGGTKPLQPKNGKEVYEMVCQSCHMADAKGGAGAGVIPALANNPRMAAPAYPIILVQKGKGGMPWFHDSLTPTQVAEVLTYIRTNFGNNYPQPITAEEVLRFAPPPPK